MVALGDPSSVVRSLVRGLMKALEDSDGAFATIAASDLERTVVRVPRLGDGPAQGDVRTTDVPPKPVAISRADVASFMLRELVERGHVGRAPFLIR